VARPPTKDVTDRELEVLHIYWQIGPATAQQARDALAVAGRDLAYTTVATLVRILADKGYLAATNSERPFCYRPIRPYAEVARRMLDDLVERVFRGSRTELLLRLFEPEELAPTERATLERILEGLER
jgi:predicted transcriptional regulator